MWISLNADQASTLPTPCFVYDAKVLRARVAVLRALDARLLCAVKANPHPGVLRVVQPLLDGADVASQGELDAALAAGFRGDTLSFAGPVKTASALEHAARVGATISLESLRELDVLEQLGVPVRLRLRVNAKTAFTAYRVAMTGGPSVFGFDEETLDEVLPRVRAAKHLELVGVHLHPGAQCTSVAGVLEVARVGLGLLERVGGAELNLGGGFGAVSPSAVSPSAVSPSAVSSPGGGARSTELDVAALAPRLRELVETWRARTGRSVSLCFEPGRWLFGPAGLYVTRVVSQKVSRGTHFVLVDGGVHHFFSASAVLMPPKAARPPVLNLSRPDAPLVVRSINGVLCTPLDSLAVNVELPEPREGDLLAFQGAGAYGPSFSPGGFLSHARPGELLVD